MCIRKARREYITLAWVMISHTAIILPDPPPTAQLACSPTPEARKGKCITIQLCYMNLASCISHTLSCIMVHFTSQNNLCNCKITLSKMFVDNQNSFSYGSPGLLIFKCVNNQSICVILELDHIISLSIPDNDILTASQQGFA